MMEYWSHRSKGQRYVVSELDVLIASRLESTGLVGCSCIVIALSSNK